MNRSMFAAAAFLSVIIAGRPLSGLPAQAGGTVSGTVHDATTGEAVPYVIVEIGDRLRTVADTLGTFVLDDVSPGNHQLIIRRTGYVTRTVDVDMNAAGFVSLTLALQPTTVELAPLSVEAESVEAPRHLAGFERRRRMGTGHHLTREEFERWNPSQVSDILRHVPSVRVRPNPRYGFDGDSRRFIVETRRGGEIGYGRPEGPECPVLYFLDGVAAGSGQNTDIDYFLSVYQVDAVETYVGAQVPIAFQQPGSACGVVAFWTRQVSGDDRVGGPPVLPGLLGATAGVGLALLSPEGCRTCLIGTDDRLKRAVGNAVILGLAGVAVSWLFVRSDGPRVAMGPMGQDGYGIAASVPVGLHR